jgi:hypothetical protein
VRRDDDAAVVGLAPEDGGDQVRERLPGTGAGFDAEHLFVVERVDDGAQHGELLRPVFVLCQRAADRTRGTEQVGDCRAVQ